MDNDKDEPRPIPRSTVYNSDSRYVLNVVEEESVHFVMTSPPYCVGKEYDDPASTLMDHLENIIPPLVAAARTLVPGGFLLVNFIDWRVKGGYYPYRDIVILALLEAGLMWENPGVWSKPFLYRHNPNNETRLHTEYQIMANSEYLLGFRKPGERAITLSESLNAKASIRCDAEVNEYSMLKNVQEFNAVKRRNDCPKIGNAAFPPQMVSYYIRMFSFTGDRILDVFAGSATVLDIAEEMGREGIGFERNPEIIEWLGSMVSPVEVPTIEPILPEGWKRVAEAQIEHIKIGKDLRFKDDIAEQSA